MYVYFINSYNVQGNVGQPDGVIKISRVTCAYLNLLFLSFLLKTGL